MEGRKKIKGIKNTVTIKRDNLGVPFIEAENMDDLAFTIGYVNAADRLNQMIGFKLISQGRLSEMIGPGGLEIDMFMRALNLNKTSGLLLKAMSEENKKQLKNFCQGVNAYIAENIDNLPPDLQLAGYTPGIWEVKDSMNLFALLNLALGFNFHEEINALNLIQKIGAEKACWLFPIYPDEKFPFEEALKLKGIDFKVSHESLEKLLAQQQRVLDFTTLGVAASNNWAISKEKTKNGASICANDTHLPLSFPSIWFMMHARCPEYDAAGVGVPGLPAVVAGFNGHIAWGMTMVMADNQDIFLEKLQLQDGKLHYLYKDKWIPATERLEIFKVKGEKEPVARVIYETVHGPILNDILKNERKHMFVSHPVDLPFGIAINWAAFESDETVNAFFDLGKCRTVEEATPVIKKIRDIPLNVVYADRDNIAWQVTGRYPIRRKGRGLYPSPGWTGEYDWEGYLDVTRHPSLLNPPEGYVATANNRTIPADSDVILSSSWHFPDRVERIRELITASDTHTLESNKTMHYDVTSPYVAKLKKVIINNEFLCTMEKEIESWKDKKRRNRAREAITILKRFDGDMRAESPDAPVVEALLCIYAEKTFLDELGPKGSQTWESFLDNSSLAYSAIVDHIVYRGDESPFWDDINTSEKETKAQIMARSLADTIALLEKALGKNRDTWQWGKIHTYTFKTETTQMAKHMGKLAKTAMKVIAPFFNRGPYPAGGSYTTINVAGYNIGKDFEVWLVPEMRMITDFSQEEPLVLVNSTGQADNPVSPHYEDGIHAWLNGDYQSFPFKEKNINKQYTRTLMLIPE